MVGDEGWWAGKLHSKHAFRRAFVRQQHHSRSRPLTCFRAQNGGYANPPPVKRQFRDPYGDWWDKQERRNYGEPLHEDNDVLAIFSPEEYTHFKPNWGWVLFGAFWTTFGSFCAVTYYLRPDKPSAPRTFPDGLEKELGGPGALRVSCCRRSSYQCANSNGDLTGEEGRRGRVVKMLRKALVLYIKYWSRALDTAPNHFLASRLDFSFLINFSRDKISAFTWVGLNDRRQKSYITL
ncbi:hypothetical protein MPH_08960 [Macrophomina phaseolina MS6]|uniref:Uncharacterized protein n=1 Tax=Macrophomina phaseolina (strain MS6) TaxID=1126212 RepID=K2RM23_MACPH|nr:hypothetical protein MPH_08960 [Macrophomina phaseolina MS6]